MRRVLQLNETVDDFITCSHSLIDRCDYGTIKDEMDTDRLVVELKDKAISEHLQMDSELTLKKKLLIWPVARSELKNHKCCATMIATDQLKPFLDKKHRRTTRSGSKRSNWGGNYTSHPRAQCPAKKARCMNCGKYGHFKRFAVRNEFIIYRKNKLMKSCHFSMVLIINQPYCQSQRLM